MSEEASSHGKGNHRDGSTGSVRNDEYAGRVPEGVQSVLAGGDSYVVDSDEVRVLRGDDGFTHVMLSDDEKERFWNAMAEECGTEARQSVRGLAADWKVESGGQVAMKRAAMIRDVTGAEGYVRQEADINYELEFDDDELQATRMMVEASRQILRDEYGDSMELHRGLNEESYDSLLVQSAEAVTGRSESLTLEANTLENFSENEETAGEFAEEYETGTVTVEADVDSDVMVATDAFLTTKKADEAEVTARGEVLDEVDPTGVELDRGPDLASFIDDPVGSFATRRGVRTGFSTLMRDMGDAVRRSEVSDKEALLEGLIERVEESAESTDLDRRSQRTVERGVNELEMTLEDMRFEE